VWKRVASVAAFAVAVGITSTDSAQEPGRGEQLMSANCIGCHDLRPIEVQALDKDGWTAIVNAMVEKGAKVDKADVPVLVEYLTENHGPLPEGAGQKILLDRCTLCHDLKRVLRHGASRQDWEDTLAAMLNEGAMLSDEEFPVLLNYLARNFKPE
jgi:cytochrome c5